MAIILGALALFVGFCALWLASFALRKIDSQINDFLKGPVAHLRENVSEAKLMASSTQSELEKFQRQNKEILVGLSREIENLRNANAQSNKALSEVAETVKAVAAAQQSRTPQQSPARRQIGA